MSDDVSGMNVTEFMNLLIKKVNERGGSGEDIHRLATPEGEGTVAKMADVVVRESNGSFPVWCTIHLGEYKSVDALVEKIEQKGGCILPMAKDLLSQITISSEKSIELIAPKVKELGFTDQVRYVDVLHRVSELGFVNVPQDTALYVALHAYELISVDVFIFCMKPVVTHFSNLSGYVFDLSRDIPDNLCLDASFGLADDMLHPEDRLVFSL